MYPRSLRTTNARRLAALACLAAVGSLPAPAAAAAACLIVEGTEIAGLRLGTPLAAALAVAGPPQGQQAVGRQVTYTLRAPWASMVVEDGVVQRLATRSPACKTAARVGPGSTLRAIGAAYASARASITAVTAAGDLLFYPFEGIAFLLRRGRADAVEVFPRDVPTASSAGAQAPATPAPTPWAIRAVDARVDGVVLVVSGTVENRGRAMLAYAEVAALDDRGRQVATGDSPLDPNPVPHGGTATFEVRLNVDDVVRRYTVTVRPVGWIAGSLADQTGEIRDRQQFNQVVMRRLQVAAEPAAGPPRVVVAVRNGSVAAVASATAAVEYETRCVIPVPRPGRSISIVGSGLVTVGQIPAGGTVQTALAVANSTPGCEHFAVIAARARIADAKVAD
ncbi:MAG: hypothetical protein QN187_02325 [Armatimonadota bacterium]|nr:hypothetical protein [Armatimonadota bacterium]MDR7548424.1 hypothetical protein [Armatimonadota bacterium]